MVFTTSIGTLFEPRRVNTEFDAILKAAGLPRVRVHDLRRSTATLLMAQGVHPRVVQETLGHSRISLTLGLYSHALPDLQRSVAHKMDAQLDQEQG